jgi:hypothetical protein
MGPIGARGCVTLDFGNTLVPVQAAALRGVVDLTAIAMAERAGPFTVDDFLAAWAEERERQFREEIPRWREVDIAQRIMRVLARLRGLAPPPPDVAWDDEDAAERSTPEEIAFAIDTYSGAFVDAVPAPPGVEPCSPGWRGAPSNLPTGRSPTRSTGTSWPRQDRHWRRDREPAGGPIAAPPIFRATETAWDRAADPVGLTSATTGRPASWGKRQAGRRPTSPAAGRLAVAVERPRRQRRGRSRGPLLEALGQGSSEDAAARRPQAPRR